MAQDVYAVYGSSGFGREVMPLVRASLCSREVDRKQVVFIDDNPQALEVNGHRVMRYSEFLALNATNRQVVVAISNSMIRQNIVARCENDGVLPWSVKSESSVVCDDVSVGPGVVICPFVTLTSNIRIGSYFHANLYSYVAHDCVIGDYVTFAPAVRCNGNVVIEDHAYVGTGAVIKQGIPGRPLTIGRGAVIGMGAVVTKDVPAGVTVVGNPARAIASAG